ncbi:MAG: NERD domain-containing protein, partial [Woeseiaceae bacterium]|nr:NERD domain-containing protein [Woeseiaceae bacterium]
VTGITSVGPAVLIFAVASALMLTLLLRSSSGYLSRILNREIAEARIRRALNARSKDVLHDVILPGAYGGLAKIDHAIMTAGGILCIRSPSMRGIVFGAEDDAQWININGVKRRRFLNPLIQNEGRARAVRKVVSDIPVTNLVIFPNSVQFSSPPPKNVIRIGELESFVAKHIFGPSKVDDWDAAWLGLTSAVIHGSDARKDFAAQIGFT